MAMTQSDSTLRQRKVAEGTALSSVAAILYSTDAKHTPQAEMFGSDSAASTVNSVDDRKTLINKASPTAMLAQQKFQAEQLKVNFNLVIRLNQKLKDCFEKTPSFFSEGDKFFYFNVLKEIKEMSEKFMLALVQVEMVTKIRGYVPSKEIASLHDKLNEIYKDLKKYPTKLSSIFKKAIAQYTAAVEVEEYFLVHPEVLLASTGGNLFPKNLMLQWMSQSLKENTALLKAVIFFKKETYKTFGLIEQPQPSKDPLSIFKKSESVLMDIKGFQMDKASQVQCDRKDEKQAGGSFSFFEVSGAVVVKGNVDSFRSSLAYKR